MAAIIVTRGLGLSLWLRVRLPGGRHGGRWVMATIEHFLPIWRRIAEYRRRDQREDALARGAEIRLWVEAAVDFVLFVVIPSGIAIDELAVDSRTSSIVLGVIIVLVLPLLTFVAGLLDIRDLWRTRPGAPRAIETSVFE